MMMPRSSPSEQGVDARGLLRLLDALEPPGHGTHSLMIARHGAVIAEGWWAPYARDRVHLGYSLSKSFTATALGVLAEQGAIELDAPVLSYLVDLDTVDEVWRRVTVRHCISMTAGHSAEAWDWRGDSVPPDAGEGDPILGAILTTRVPDGEPGEVWAYNQVATYLVAQAVAAATGRSLTDQVRRLVIDPLTGDSARAQRTPQGRDLGFSGMHVTTPTILALAQTWLDGGRWQGEQLVPSSFAAAAPRPTPASLRASGMLGDWNHGYGMSFWGASHGYRGDGAYGQYAIVLPEYDVAVAITSEVVDMQVTLDHLWAHLLPAMVGATDPDADEQLDYRLGALRHPARSGGAAPHRVLTATRHEQSQLPPVYQSVTVQTTTAGHHRLVLHRSDGDLVTVVGDGTWLESTWPTPAGQPLAVAASGGWQGEAFTAELRLVETPHTMTVTVADGSVRLNWVMEPLTGPDPLQAVSFPF
ncbi:serine hydrolase domain-containing protein [Micropruina sp.]|uniref:serine hydrolase domain-containing protein n=1 Tax=Micropruina sp. TaxID=2737536 RepID=UPI0039E5CAEC